MNNFKVVDIKTEEVFRVYDVCIKDNPTSQQIETYFLIYRFERWAWYNAKFFEPKQEDKEV